MKKIVLYILIFSFGFTAIPFAIFVWIFIQNEVLPDSPRISYAMAPDNDHIAEIFELPPLDQPPVEYEVTVSNGQARQGSVRVAYFVNPTPSKCSIGLDLEWKSDQVLLIKLIGSENYELNQPERFRVKMVHYIPKNNAPCRKT